jgi:hypothetical protein
VSGLSGDCDQNDVWFATEHVPHVLEVLDCLWCKKLFNGRHLAGTYLHQVDQQGDKPHERDDCDEEFLVHRTSALCSLEGADD